MVMIKGQHDKQRNAHCGNNRSRQQAVSKSQIEAFGIGICEMFEFLIELLLITHI